MIRRRRLASLVAVIAALAIAIPVVGADPSPSAGPSDPAATASTDPSAAASPVEAASPAGEASPTGAPSPIVEASPGRAPNPDAVPQADPSPKPGNGPKPGKGPKVDKGPEIAVTATGTVVQSTDGKGRPAFTLSAGGTTWDLSAGPPWFWGANNPLVAYVGKSVTVTGTHHQGDTDLSVDTVDGKAIRAAGKPPWAGGPWVVGSSHPGWKDWMADGKPGKGLGRENAPGQNKDSSTGS